jgi:hypothetical protein
MHITAVGCHWGQWFQLQSELEPPGLGGSPFLDPKFSQAIHTPLSIWKKQVKLVNMRRWSDRVRQDSNAGSFDSGLNVLTTCPWTFYEGRTAHSTIFGGGGGRRDILDFFLLQTFDEDLFPKWTVWNICWRDKLFKTHPFPELLDFWPCHLSKFDRFWNKFEETFFKTEW